MTTSNGAISPSSREWVNLPEIPSSREIIGANHELILEANKIEGPWPSKEAYLRAHYELLREDAVCPLRQAVDEVVSDPGLLEADSYEKSGIYDHVYIKGITLAESGLAVKVSFCLNRVQKRIRWDQSKRLITGTLVALTTTDNMFESVCKLAVVASRDIEALVADPPTIDLFFGDNQEIEIDPHQEWFMIEARQGYFEAYRHTLRTLQTLDAESFPLSEHIVETQLQIEAPQYLQDQPRIDLRAAMTTASKAYESTDILHDWPKFRSNKMQRQGAPDLPTDLDPSQLEALRRILTKKLAVVQGPPGTGKTHVSVASLKVMLANRSVKDPPILVACQTNHALDQLLRHISRFEPNFIRLGSRTTDIENIHPRTMWEVKNRAPPSTQAKGPSRQARRAWETACEELAIILKPMTSEEHLFSAETFLQKSLISDAQYESLVSNTKAKKAGLNFPAGPLMLWLDSQAARFEPKQWYSELDMEFEARDEEYEQIKELEAETGGDGDRLESLRGKFHHFREQLTGRVLGEMPDSHILGLLKVNDLWQIPAKARGAVYAYLRKRLVESIRHQLRVAAARYAQISNDIKKGTWHQNHSYLQAAPVIGMTTTGLGKYREYLAALHPRIVLIEEAAETMEVNVVSACFPSLQHLILVGDHKQLRSQCSVKDLEGHPFYLDISLFERLMRNNIEYSQLKRQRRMRPEIRELINPIYEELYDHPSVLDRDDVPGMGGINSWFYTHEQCETVDETLSKRNVSEAMMVAGFFAYLVHNGTPAKKITVLTFYNAQRKCVLGCLRSNPDLAGSRFQVATVDAYQGEENDVVLLSLVRNNERGDIGFLRVENRVCVALSRARNGFYLFGNHEMLNQQSDLWRTVLWILDGHPRRLDHHIPITCRRHGTKVNMQNPTDWQDTNGGCLALCHRKLPCGHQCVQHCHPYPEDQVICHQDCTKVLACKHKCSEKCHTGACSCRTCERSRNMRMIADKPPGRLWETPEVRGDQSPSAQSGIFDMLVSSLGSVLPESQPTPRLSSEAASSKPSSRSGPNSSPHGRRIPGVTKPGSLSVESERDSVFSSYRGEYLSEEERQRRKNGTKAYQDYAAGGVVEADRALERKRGAAIDAQWKLLSEQQEKAPPVPLGNDHATKEQTNGDQSKPVSETHGNEASEDLMDFEEQ